MLGRLVYRPKRSGKRAKGGQSIDLETLAKVRYAYLFEPHTIHSRPKSLWSASGDGNYRKAFGIDGVVVEKWSKHEVERALFAYATHAAAQQSGLMEKQRDIKYKYLGRLRYHAVSLAGYFMTTAFAPPTIGQLLGEPEMFNQWWEEKIWPACFQAFTTAHKFYVIREDTSVFALVRNTDAWEDMKETFENLRRKDLRSS